MWNRGQALKGQGVRLSMSIGTEMGWDMRTQLGISAGFEGRVGEALPFL